MLIMDMDKREELVEELADVLSNLSDETLMKIYNSYREHEGKEKIHEMEDFNDIYQWDSPLDVADLVLSYEGTFSPSDYYFVDGELESSDYVSDLVEHETEYGDIANWIIDTDNTLGIRIIEETLKKYESKDYETAQKEIMDNLTEVEKLLLMEWENSTDNSLEIIFKKHIHNIMMAYAIKHTPDIATDLDLSNLDLACFDFITFEDALEDTEENITSIRDAVADWLINTAP